MASRGDSFHDMAGRGAVFASTLRGLYWQRRSAKRRRCGSPAGFAV